MGTLFVDNIKHESAQGSGTITLGASGEKVDLGTGVSGGTLTNRPAFYATKSATQSIANNTTVVITFDGTDFDTDNAFNTTDSTFVVPTGKAGKYYLRGQARCPGVDAGEIVQIQLTKNGSIITRSLERRYASATDQHQKVRTSIVENLAEGDAIDMRIYQNSGASQNLTESETAFEGFRLIGV